METTGRFDLPLIMPNQAQKHVTHNEALTLIDGLCHLVITSFGENSPPVTALIDDAFVVGTAPTGDWFGEGGNIAFNTDAGWRFIVPRQGIIAFNAATSKLMIHDQNIWKPLDSALNSSSPTTLGINTSSDTNNRLALRSNAALLTAINTGDGGNGDMQLKINKELVGDTASLLYQTGFSGRAEMGLAGDDDFRIKVSPNGSTWTDAVVVNKTTGAVTLANNSVANAALTDMPNGNFKARVAAGSGDPQDITGTQATALLDTFTTTLKGLAPASGGGIVNFLRADGTWATPAAGTTPAWGAITGALSAQTDLQTALNSKAASAHTHAQADVTGLVAALAAKEPTINAGTASQYIKGDKTLGTHDKASVGLGNVDNTSDAAKPVSTAMAAALAGKSDTSHTHAAATTAVAGFLSSVDKTKLDGIAAGATANSADATLLARANHTGTQVASTISDFAESVDDRVAALLVAGTNITLSYNDAGNALTINAAGGSGAPGGAVTRIQYNNGGVFDGASRLAVNSDGNLLLVTTSTPTLPPANTLQIHARRRAGADFPEVLRPNGRELPLQTHMGWNRVSLWTPLTGTTVNTQGIPRTAVGTVSTPALSATDFASSVRRWRMTSAATASSVCDERAAATVCWRGNAAGLGGFLYTNRISLVTLQTGAVAFFGLLASTSALATTQTIAALTNCVGIGFTNGTNANWQLIFNDGTATPTLVDLGASFPVANTANLYTLMIYAPPNGTSIGVRVTCENTGAVFEQDLTTKIPASTTFLSVRNFMHNGLVAAAVAYDCSGIYLETDI